MIPEIIRDERSCFSNCHYFHMIDSTELNIECILSGDKLKPDYDRDPLEDDEFEYFVPCEKCEVVYYNMKHRNSR